MQPAPYGGFMTRTIDEEKTEKSRLKNQQVPVDFNGVQETLRPEAVHVRGVDNLATDQIESFVEMYLEPAARGQFRIQWIDDSNANVVFKSHKAAVSALACLAEHWDDVPETPDNGVASVDNGEASVDAATSENADTMNVDEKPESPFSKEYLDNLLVERPAKSYAATLDFHKERVQAKAEASDDLFREKKAEAQLHKEVSESMDEDGSAVQLYVRQSVQSDRKPKNAKEFSRYYLLHGEPDRTRSRGRTGQRGHYSRDDEDGDLFASKLEATRKKRDDEEDLFAWRMRERSPGRT